MNDYLKSVSAFKAEARRLDPERVEVCWTQGEGIPALFVYAANDENPVRVSVEHTREGCFTISGIDPSVRYYYHLVDKAGNRVMTAERRVLLQGAVNFRDIGGYLAKDGRRVRWGRVFRSDGLSALTDSDHHLIRHMGIKRVYDFRTSQEAKAAPDRLPDGMEIEYTNLPVTHGGFDFLEAVKRLKQGDASWLTPDFMVNGYIDNLETFGGVWGEVINHLAASDGEPILFHCTGGKDRTGSCAALILLLLGVPEETVVDDHQLSNIYIAELLPRIFKLMASYGLDPERIAPYLTAPRECILAFLDHIRKNYGSAAEYLLQKAGVSIQNQEALKQKLLV